MRILTTPYTALLSVALFFGLLVWWDSTSVYTQADPTIPYQLTNQHVDPMSAAPSGFTELNGAVYFGLASEKHGLWQTDGTAQGTVLVKDIQLYPDSLQRVGNLLYFAVYEEDFTFALGRSDGTTDGTFVLTSIPSLLYATQFVELGNTFYFAASDAEHGVELWKSDGTAAGTQLVVDLNSGQQGTYPQQLTVTNGLLYFVGYDEQQYRERLWQSDGTAAGTQLVPGAPAFPRTLTAMQNALYFVGTDQNYNYALWRYTPSEPTPTQILDLSTSLEGALLGEIVVFKNRLFFAATSAQAGLELWQSDGTTVGTTLVKDIAVGPAKSSSPRSLTVVGDLLYFRATDGNTGYELWKSDGTAAGTMLVKDITPGPTDSNLRALTAANGLLYFGVELPSAATTLWKSDGTDAGTMAVAAVTIRNYSDNLFTAIGDKLYYSGYDESHGNELWVSDGTPNGTAFVKDLDPAYSGPAFPLITRVGERLYFMTALFSFYDYEQEKLWMSVGQGAPPTLVAEQMTISQVRPLGDSLLLIGADADGAGLWRHDGTAATLTLVKRFTQQSLLNLIVLKDKLFFHVYPNSSMEIQSYDLWRSDGTADGTIELVTGTGANPAPSPQLVFNGQVFATDRSDLWLLGDTPTTTTHFRPPGITGTINSLVNTATALYFVMSQPVNGGGRIDTLWRSDGTAAGTRQLSFTPAVTYISELISVDKGLYLVAEGQGQGRELWYNDDTTQTLTQLVTLPVPQYYLNFTGATHSNGQLFFIADDGVHGPELWRSDGTPTGTFLVKDIAPPELAGVPAAYPGPLFEFGDLLYFGMNDGVHGQELWRSDGTTAGTALLTEINPTAASSSPGDFVARTGQFFFTATDGVHGRELWQSDGTVAGTRLVTDLYPGSASALPSSLSVFSNTLYFTANNGVDGRQLFELRAGVPLSLPEAGEPMQHYLYLPITQQ